MAQSRSENPVPGGTGHWPVPFGDPPDGTGDDARGSKSPLLARRLRSVPVGGSPTGGGRVARTTQFSDRLSSARPLREAF